MQFNPSRPRPDTFLVTPSTSALTLISGYDSGITRYNNPAVVPVKPAEFGYDGNFCPGLWPNISETKHRLGVQKPRCQYPINRPECTSRRRKAAIESPSAAGEPALRRRELVPRHRTNAIEKWKEAQDLGYFLFEVNGCSKLRKMQGNRKTAADVLRNNRIAAKHQP